MEPFFRRSPEPTSRISYHSIIERIRRDPDPMADRVFRDINALLHSLDDKNAREELVSRITSGDDRGFQSAIQELQVSCSLRNKGCLVHYRVNGKEKTWDLDVEIAGLRIAAECKVLVGPSDQEYKTKSGVLKRCQKLLCQKEDVPNGILNVSWFRTRQPANLPVKRVSVAIADAIHRDISTGLHRSSVEIDSCSIAWSFRPTQGPCGKMTRICLSFSGALAMVHGGRLEKEILARIRPYKNRVPSDSSFFLVLSDTRIEAPDLIELARCFYGVTTQNETTFPVQCNRSTAESLFVKEREFLGGIIWSANPGIFDGPDPGLIVFGNPWHWGSSWWALNPPNEVHPDLVFVCSVHQDSIHLSDGRVIHA